jgi:hypothetical protein
MRGFAVAVLLLLPLAGCFGRDANDGDGGSAPVPAGWVDADWALRALPTKGTDDHHDHNDAAMHKGLSTPNFQVIGWDPLVSEYHHGPSGAYSCGSVIDTEERTIGVYNSFGTDVALIVVDLKDPIHPTKLGELVLPLTHVYDVSVTDDGMWALLATDPLDQGPDIPPTFGAVSPPATYTMRPLFRDACGVEHLGPETNLPYDSGLVLVDLRDPMNPTVADYAPQPVLGAHSVSAATIDGTTYVAASTTNLVHGASYYLFYTVDLLAGLGTLQPYGAMTAQYPAVPDGAPEVDAQINGHVDATLAKHPVTGQVLAYLANWNGGVTIAELAGRGNVRAIGLWNDFDPSKGAEMTGQIHSVNPMPDLRNGRHITAIGQEIGGHPANRPSGQAILLDTTDPTDPRAVARWTLPVDAQWDEGAIFSTHYLDLVGDTLFISMYHAGIWAADANESQWPNLPSLGVFLPDHDSEAPFTTGVYPWRPLTVEIGHLDDGTLVTVDHATGVYTLRYTPDDPRVPVIPGWAADDWTPDV